MYGIDCLPVVQLLPLEAVDVVFIRAQWEGDRREREREGSVRDKDGGREEVGGREE